MGIVGCLRNLRGYVEFEIRGDMRDRFINRCASEALPVWGIHKRGDRFYGYTYAKQYRAVARLAKACGVRSRVCKRHGIVFTAHRYKRRTGLLIGVLFFVLFLGGTQNFIWSVDVSGNRTVTGEQVLAVMEDLGVKFGAFKGNLDLESIGAAALARFEQFSWIAVNRMGTKIHVEVRERSMAPEIVSEREPCNLVAAKDGVITGMRVRAGQKEVQKGSIVLKGDLLVNGILEDKKGNNLFRHADGEVYAKTTVSKTVRVEIAAKEVTGVQAEKAVRALDLFGFRIPLSFHALPSDDGVLTVERRLSVFGAQLPVGIETRRYRIYTETDRMRRREQAERIAQAKLSVFEKQSLSEAKILSKKCTYRIEDATLVCRAEYRCEENIAKPEKIYFTAQKK